MNEDNLFWEEPDGWRFWIVKNNKYFFNDIPDNLTDSIEYAVKINEGPWKRRSTTIVFKDNDILHI